MYAGLAPPDPRRIGIVARERARSVKLAHAPLAGLELAEIDERGRPPLAAGVLVQAPAAEMMRAGHDARAHRLGDPRLVDEVADAGRDLQKIARRDAQPRRILGMDPQRVRV